ncbi:hypothetical protein D3C77_320280 [compost metagenome]
MFDGFQASLDAGAGELALVGFTFDQWAVFAALLFVQFFQLAADGIASCFQLGNAGGLVGIVTAHDQFWRQQVGIGLALARAADDQWLPAIDDQLVHVILQGGVPVILKVLVDVIRIQKRCGLEAMQQVFGQQLEQRLRLVANGDTGEVRAVLAVPAVKQIHHGLAEGVELGVVEDARLDLADRHCEVKVARALRLEQSAAQIRHYFPVALQGLDITLGDAAVQVGLDVLKILLFAGVDIARDIQVEVVGLDLGQRY